MHDMSLSVPVNGTAVCVTVQSCTDAILSRGDPHGLTRRATCLSHVTGTSTRLHTPSQRTGTVHDITRARDGKIRNFWTCVLCGMQHTHA